MEGVKTKIRGERRGWEDVYLRDYRGRKDDNGERVRVKEGA